MSKVSSCSIVINGRFLTQQITGVQRYARELIHAMDRLLGTEYYRHLRRAITVLTPRGALIAHQPFEHIQVKAAGWLQGHAWEQFELPLMSRGQLLFSPCNTSPLAVRRAVVTLHDCAVFTHADAYSWQFRAWYRFMFRHLARSVNRIITVSEFSKSELVRRCGAREDHTTVTHLGHEHILRVTPDDRIIDRLGLQGEDFALAVSSNNPNKNFSGLLAALALMGRPKFRVVIAGGGAQHVFSSTDRIDPDFVVRTGYISDAELRALYDSARSFIFPSFYEGFGIPPLEALACGISVLAADIPVLREVLGDAASYCDPHSPSSIATEIDRLMQRPSRNEPQVRQLLAKMTWEDCAHLTLNVLAEELR
jgi:glycosyltransferase involved in cell wall biosynthesis